MQRKKDETTTATALASLSRGIDQSRQKAEILESLRMRYVLLHTFSVVSRRTIISRFLKILLIRYGKEVVDLIWLFCNSIK